MRDRWAQWITMAVLSVILAFFFWAVATEAEDPMVEQTYPASVRIETRNVPEGMTVYNLNEERATVRLRAPESLWQLLEGQTGMVRAYVSLAGAEPGTLTLPVQVEVTRRPAQVVRVSPSEVTLELAPLAERDVPVVVEVTDVPAQGFVARSPIYAPRIVTVIGPEPQVERVTQVVIEISVEDQRRSVSDDFQPVPLDELGDPVAYVELVPRTVTVEVPVEQLGNIRDVAVHVLLEDQPAPGFRVVQVTVEPPVVTVTGRRDVVQATSVALRTEPISLEGVQESFSTTVGLQLPEGLSVLTTPEVFVSVEIEMLESRVSVPRDVELRGLSGAYTATVSPATVEIVVTGPFRDVEALDPLEVELYADLATLGEGEHTVPLEVVLPIPTLEVVSILPQRSVVVDIRRTGAP